MKEKANYVKLTVKLSNTIEAKYYEKGNKELYYSVRTCLGSFLTYFWLN
ncbi:hypothetical protein [Spiroplasma endosymbiont of Dactylopius coccus]